MGTLPAPTHRAMAATMGVRPEDVSLDGSGGIAGRIEQVEPLGAETVVAGPDRRARGCTR